MVDHLPARAIDRLMILTAALLFSTGGAAVKACSLSGWQVASLRSGIAAIALLILLPSARKGWNWRTWLVGSAFAATMISFVLANKLTTAANAVFLQSTAPLYILILSPFLLGEPSRRRQLVFMAALAVGMWFILSGGQSVSETSPDPTRGNIIGAFCGFSWAFTMMGLRWLSRDQHIQNQQNSGASAVICGSLISCLITLPFALPIRGASPTDWTTVAFLGIFQIALAYVLILRGVRRVGALEVSLLVLVEPVFGPLWAWLFHAERPSSWALLGGLVIVLATAVYSWASETSHDPSVS